jgi:hypothetical protein
MGKPFSRLKQSLKEVGTGTASPTAAAYLNFLQGNVHRTIPNAVPAGAARIRAGVGILPFGVDQSANPAPQYYGARITGYSFKGWTTRCQTVLSAAKLGIQEPVVKGVIDSNLIAANLKVRLTSSQGSANPKKPSTIIVVPNRTYNYTPTRTFAIPFGRDASATLLGEEDRWKILAPLCESITGFKGVSLRNEIYYKESVEEFADPTSITGLGAVDVT